MIVEITFEHDVPEDVTGKEIRDWAEFVLGVKGSLKKNNNNENLP